MVDFRLRGKIVLTLAACAALAISGCKSGTEKAADKNLESMKSANSDTAATSVGKSDLPPACDAYITKVDACVKTLGGNNAQMAGQFKQSMETARASWANIQDKAQLANMCKQADATFAQTSAAMGCK
jgi:hypothetical protein